MNYFIEQLEEEIVALKTFGATIDKLCELAKMKGPQNTIEDWEKPELFDWTRHDTLFSQHYKDDTLPFLKWTSVNDYCMYHTFTDGKNYFNLNLAIGQGSELCFYILDDGQVTENIKANCSQIVAVKQLAEDKVKFLEQKLAEMKVKDQSREAIKKDLKTRLDTVRLVKNLMDDMGLSFDDYSKNKIIGWEKEYRNL